MKNSYRPFRLFLLIVFCLLTIFSISGAKWERLKGIGGENLIWNVVEDERNPGYIFASYYFDVYFSSDYGDTWSKIVNLPEASGAAGVLAAKYPHIVVGSSGNKLRISNDYGKTWFIREKFPIYRSQAKCAVFKGDTLFIGTDLGIQMSTDFGDTWIDLVPKPPNDTVLQLGSIFNIKIKNDYIYASHYMQGVIRSTDNGLSWEKISNNKLKDKFGKIMYRPTIYQVFFVEDLLYAFNGSCLWATSDDGENWDLINVLPIGDSALGGFVVCNKSIFSGNEVFGFFISIDYGKSFHTYNDGYTIQPNMFGITITDKYAYLCAGSFIYRAPMKDCEFIETNAVEERINTDIGISISPNPAGEYIEISVLNKGLHPLVPEQEIKIFNLLGECVVSAGGAGGTHPLIPSQEGNVRIDVSGLPSGVYFVRVGGWVGRFVKI